MGREVPPGDLPGGDGARYTWTCPVCELSRTSVARSDAGEETAVERALNALESHIASSEGDGHGPTEEAPTEFDRERLVEFVTLGESRR